jgi:hypothetical protein
MLQLSENSLGVNASKRSVGLVQERHELNEGGGGCCGGGGGGGGKKSSLSPPPPAAGGGGEREEATASRSSTPAKNTREGGVISESSALPFLPELRRGLFSLIGEQDLPAYLRVDTRYIDSRFAFLEGKIAAVVKSVDLLVHLSQTNATSAACSQQPFKMRQSTDSMPSGGTSARIPSARARQLSAARTNPNSYGGEGLKPTAGHAAAVAPIVIGTAKSDLNRRFPAGEAPISLDSTFRVANANALEPVSHESVEVSVDSRLAQIQQSLDIFVHRLQSHESDVFEMRKQVEEKQQQQKVQPMFENPFSSASAMPSFGGAGGVFGFAARIPAASTPTTRGNPVVACSISQSTKRATTSSTEERLALAIAEAADYKSLADSHRREADALREMVQRLQSHKPCKAPVNNLNIEGKDPREKPAAKLKEKLELGQCSHQLKKKDHLASDSQEQPTVANGPNEQRETESLPPFSAGGPTITLINGVWK